MAVALLVGWAATRPETKPEVLGVQYEAPASSTTSSTIALETSTTIAPAAATPSTAAASASKPAASAPAQPTANTGSIVGTVTRRGAPLSGAQIKVTLADGGQLDTSTDSSGNYALAGVPVGHHQVQVIDPGYGQSCDAAGNCIANPSQTANRSADVTAGQESRVNVNFS